MPGLIWLAPLIIWVHPPKTTRPCLLAHDGFHSSYAGKVVIICRWCDCSSDAPEVCGCVNQCKWTPCGLPHLLILPQCLAFGSQATWICWGRAMAAVLSAKLCWAWGTVWVTGDEPCAPCLHSDQAAPDGNGISMRLDGEAPWGEVQVFPLLWARAELQKRARALLTSHKNSFVLVKNEGVFSYPTSSWVS